MHTAMLWGRGFVNIPKFIKAGADVGTEVGNKKGLVYRNSGIWGTSCMAVAASTARYFRRRNPSSLSRSPDHRADRL